MPLPSDEASIDNKIEAIKCGLNNVLNKMGIPFDSEVFEQFLTFKSEKNQDVADPYTRLLIL